MPILPDKEEGRTAFGNLVAEEKVTEGTYFHPILDNSLSTAWLGGISH
jgi:hypothetical protein